MELELLHFPYSHYNEKARWALEFKQAPHRKMPLMPGPHKLTTKKLTGQTQTPILRIDGRYVCGSNVILEELEKLYPEPALFPEKPEEVERALEICRWFDDEIGPRLRRPTLAPMAEDVDYLCRVFAEGQSKTARWLYRASLPLARHVMVWENGITSESVADGDRATLEGLEFVAREAGPEGYLVGGRFTLADLTAASILAPAVDPPDSSMARPRPMPEKMVAWLERWADHPGAEWVREMYRRHRCP